MGASTHDSLHPSIHIFFTHDSSHRCPHARRFGDLGRAALVRRFKINLKSSHKGPAHWTVALCDGLRGLKPSHKGRAPSNRRVPMPHPQNRCE
jgi:hypothetical protein